MGIFYDFIDDKEVALTGVEAAGDGVATGRHAASINGGTVGVLHGSKSYLLQTPSGQIVEAYSVSAGLDYPGVGPEHAFLHDSGRARYEAITDAEAVEAFQLTSRLEGIIPALESSHAIAQALKSAARRPKGDVILVSLSGRGDKDMDNVRSYLERQQKEEKR